MIRGIALIICGALFGPVAACLLAAVMVYFYLTGYETP